MSMTLTIKLSSGVIQEMGNPFYENSTDFLMLDTRDVAYAAIIDTVSNIENLGRTNMMLI